MLDLLATVPTFGLPWPQGASLCGELFLHMCGGPQHTHVFFRFGLIRDLVLAEALNIREDAEDKLDLARHAVYHSLEKVLDGTDPYDDPWLGHVGCHLWVKQVVSYENRLLDALGQESLAPLQWMRKSIKHFEERKLSRRFVDVYHPEWSSASSLAKSVELFSAKYALCPCLSLKDRVLAPFFCVRARLIYGSHPPWLLASLALTDPRNVKTRTNKTGPSRQLIGSLWPHCSGQEGEGTSGKSVGYMLTAASKAISRVGCRKVLKMSESS